MSALKVDDALQAIAALQQEKERQEVLSRVDLHDSPIDRIYRGNRRRR